MSTHSSSIRRNNTVQNASLIASDTAKLKKVKDPSEFVVVSRTLIEFQLLALQAQLKLLDELAEMSDEEKLKTIFELLDKDNDGKISAVELADGLRKIRGDVNFEESIELAINRVATFDSNEDGKLDSAEFKTYVDTLLSTLGCSFGEVSEMIVVQMIFSESGNNMGENIAGALLSPEIDEAVKVEEDFRKALGDKRMKALFALFDIDGDRNIDFKEIVLGMYKLTDDLDDAASAAVEALLVFDESHTRKLNFEEFARFMHTVVAASGKKFDDVADKITKLVSDEHYMSPDDVKDLFAMDESMKMLMEIQADAEDAAKILTAIEIGKSNRLFDLLDLDNDGAIDFHELTLGLRKFSEREDMRSTIEKAMSVINTFDTEGKQKLNKQEFALFIAEFARKSEADVRELVDFMLVCSALKETPEKEEAYIKSLSTSDVYFGEY
uniref:EF-hand domain-containing protein n=1 Tax=Helicotheca tamesis TaxID=374047 RepID=A0A7S2MT52_9STRA|eukprot:CAMPEP_0185730558 /NCGR_PEP_ID=MMETSP1171-20130828/10240_1 /TAXON_ID=374046 /ORGANISM="Helicotheca tamensis, Strain CCMP826" /LENGTH=439 /DNA_ID=CAMNT_0028399633 /DNA_START=45 /DNA_END=1364 /DNA_ORIENTATION=-